MKPSVVSHDPRRWAKDASAVKCLLCEVPFSVLVRRHHCRSCGEIFCEACCKQTTMLPVSAQGGAKERVRVCSSCAGVCEKSAARAQTSHAKSVGGASSDLAHFAWYWVAMASPEASAVVRKQRAVTKSNNTLQIDVAELKDEIQRLTSAASPDTKKASLRSSSPDASLLTTTNRCTIPEGQALVDSVSPPDAMQHFFSAASTSLLRQLQSRMERLTMKAVNVQRILLRHSLTHFYLELYHHLVELLMHSFVANLGAAAQHTTVITEAQHALSIRRLELHGQPANLAASAALSRTILHLEALRMPTVTAASLMSTHVGCEILDDLAEQIAIAITVRYQEQICCLTERAATVLATTAAARIHHRVHCHATASEEDFMVLLNHVPVEDYMYDAILNERPANIKEQALHTRLRVVDQSWTDHGALSCCGLATSDGYFYDPIYLGSSAEQSTTVALVRPSADGHKQSAGQRDSSVASRYYYRQGTAAEAMAMKMTATGTARHTPSPLWSAQMLHDQHQTLTRRREELLSAYCRVPFCDLHSNSWVSWLGPAAVTQREDGVSRPDSVSFRVEVLRNALRVCRDYVANTEALRQVLIRRYHSMYTELERIQRCMEELTLRAEDIHDAPLATTETRGLLMAMERIAAQNQSEHVVARLQAFHRYHKFLNPTASQTACSLFYLHLRTKLLMVLLASSRTELQDDPVTLLGNAVPYSANVALALDAMYARAARSSVYKSWWLPDVVDLHTERMARLLADRFRDTVDALSPASVLVLADCCIARLFYLFSHADDVGVGTPIAQTPKNKAGKTQPVQTSLSSFDWLLEVSVVERIECVSLFDTIVKARKVYLTLSDHKSTVSEHGLHTKSALAAGDGTWFVGTRETHGANLVHHRGPKYGYLHAYPNEISRKALLPAAADWSVDLSPVLKAKRKSFFGGGNEPKIIAALLKPPPAMSDSVHWGSCLLSVGPRHLGPGDVVGVTLTTKTKHGQTLPMEDSRRRTISFMALTGEEGRLSSTVGAAASAPSDVAIVQSFQCTTAGTLIVAAELDGVLLIGNSVTVRPGRVDWPQHCSIDVQPQTVVAGDTVSVTMTLRDEYNNVTSTTSPDDFSIAIENSGTSVVASSVTEEIEGRFGFVFVPTNEGPIQLRITAAGVTLTYDRPLRCVAGAPDFKNSMFSFDEWDVVAGTTIHGNLLLRDVYGNKVEAEDEHPLVEVINGGTAAVPVERVHRGEYIFSFCPTKQGCAIVKATSLRSFASLIARINVEAPKEVDWRHSSISCLSKILFAGEVAEFHIVVRDKFGNAIDSDAKPSDFKCWLRYVDGDDAANREKELQNTSFQLKSSTEASSGAVVGASQVTGSGASFAFRVTAGVVGKVVACAAYGNALLECNPMQVRSAPLHWQSSHVRVPLTAVVGEWVPVVIDCRDRFGNLSEAQETDFSVVAVHDASSNTEVNEDCSTSTATIKTKPVSGAGSSFGFQAMCTKTGVLRITVTYAGYLKHDCSVVMKPLPPCWMTTTVSLKPVAAVSSTVGTFANVNQVTAGSALRVVVHFRDQYGNWTHKRCEPLSIAATNESITLSVDSTADVEDDDETSWCKSVFHITPTVSGRVNVAAAWLGEPESKFAKATVVASVLDWDHCTLRPMMGSNPSSVVAAGTTVVLQVRLFDVYNNAVDAHQDSVSLRAVNSTTDDRGQSIELIADVRVAGSNELIIQCAPELSGALLVEASVDAPCETKRQLFEVTAAPLDWLGRTRVVYPVDGVAAGDAFCLTLMLRDVFDNPVTCDEWAEGAAPEGSIPFFAVLTEARNPSTKAPTAATADEQGRAWTVESPDRGVLSMRLCASVAGLASLTLRCDGMPDRPVLTLPVAANRFDWAVSEVVWEHNRFTVGSPVMCRLIWRDSLGNVTSSGLPRCSELRAEFVQRASWLVPSDDRFLPLLPQRDNPSEIVQELPVQEDYAFTLTAVLSGLAEVSIAYTQSAHPLKSDVAVVDCAKVSWQHSLFSVVPQSPELAQRGRRAGELVECLLTLRDPFSNDSVRNVASPSDIRSQVLLSGTTSCAAVVIPVTTDAQQCSDAAHFLLRFTPERVGEHTVSVGIAQASEVSDLMLRIPVGPGPVCWEQHTRLFADAESCSAGSSLFLQLECCDVFGNPTAGDVSPADIHLVLTLEQPEDCGNKQKELRSAQLSPNSRSEIVGVALGSLYPLPQRVGLYGVAAEPTSAGTLLVTVRQGDCPAVPCDEPVRVVPAAPQWQHCKLKALQDTTVCGVEALFGLELYDVYDNLVQPQPRNTDKQRTFSDGPPQKIERGESQDDLTDDLQNTNSVSTGVADFVESECRSLHLLCENSNQGCEQPQWVVLQHYPEERRIVSVPVTVRAADDPTVAQLCKMHRVGLVFTVVPTVAGDCTLRVSHEQHELVHCARVAHVLPAAVHSGQFLPASQSSAIAGVPLTFQLQLRDAYGNWLCGALVADSLAAQVRVDATAGSQPRTLEWSTATSPQGHALVVVTPTVAERVTIRFLSASVLLCTTVLDVLPGPISAEASSLHVGADTAVAGEPFAFYVIFKDQHGNAVLDPMSQVELNTQPPPDCDTKKTFLWCANGTSRPAIERVTPPDVSPPNVVSFVATPAEKSSVVLHLSDSASRRGMSVSVPVAPAPLNWSSCTVRIADDSVILGAETSVLIAGRDRFHNAVEIDSDAIIVEVVNNDVTYRVWGAADDHQERRLPECDGFVAKRGKQLLCQIKPVERGTIVCRVWYNSDESNTKTSNVCQVV